MCAFSVPTYIILIIGLLLLIEQKTNAHVKVARLIAYYIKFALSRKVGYNALYFQTIEHNDIILIFTCVDVDYFAQIHVNHLLMETNFASLTTFNVCND